MCVHQIEITHNKFIQNHVTEPRTHKIRQLICRRKPQRDRHLYVKSIVVADDDVDYTKTVLLNKQKHFLHTKHFVLKFQKITSNESCRPSSDKLNIIPSYNTETNIYTSQT